MADLIYYVGPTSNVAGITPDYTTLFDFWTNVPKDLVSRQQKCIVNLLPGIQELNEITLAGSTTNSSYYFHIRGLPGYQFNGDVAAINIPRLRFGSITPNATLIQTNSNYIIFEGFLIEGDGNIDAFSILKLAVNDFALVDSIAIHNFNINSSTDILIGIHGSNSVIRNCVINNIIFSNQLVFADNIGIHAFAPLNLDTSFCHNNTFSNLSLNYNGADRGCIILAFGGGDIGGCIYCNNVFNQFSVTNNSNGIASTGDYFELPLDSYVSYNSFDSTFNVISSTNTTTITPSNEFINTTAGNFNAKLKSTSTVHANGVDITTLTKTSNMLQSLFDFAITSPFYDINNDLINVFSRGADKPLVEISMDQISFEIPSNNYNNSLNDISGEEMSYEITKKDFVLNSFRKVR